MHHPALLPARHTRHAVLLAALLAALGASVPASAQSGTHSSIDVHGQMLPRTTLAAACPQARAELPDALAATAQSESRAGVVRVRLEVDHRGVHAVQAEGGTPTQSRAVRRAVRALGCETAGTVRQVLQFQVAFVEPGPRDLGAVALLEPAR